MDKMTRVSPTEDEGFVLPHHSANQLVALLMGRIARGEDIFNDEDHSPRGRFADAAERRRSQANGQFSDALEVRRRSMNEHVPDDEHPPWNILDLRANER